MAEEASPEGETLLDSVTLRDDYLVLGAEKTGRMVEAFRGSTPDKVAELAGAAGSRDWGRVGYLAHTLKGGAGSLGLLALESRSGVVEAARPMPWTARGWPRPWPAIGSSTRDR